MKYNHYLILMFSFLALTLSCEKEVEEPPIINVEEPEEPSKPDDSGSDNSGNNNSGSDFVQGIDPNLNEEPITFEEYGPSFDLENAQPADRSAGNWGFFGSVGDTQITVGYSENPDPDSEVNNSERVVKVTEPVGVESWAGFYFMLEEKINFPAGEEAISVQFFSPGPDHVVLLKLEDELANGTEGKKSTGDLFAETTGTGWETLVFNIPDKDGRDGFYNTITMILGYGLTNDAEVSYYIDNFNFATPVEVIAAAAPTTAPDAPTYAAEEVISIFSDAYTAVEGINLNPNWGQNTVVTEEVIAGNTVLKYENLNYQGTTFETAIDVSSKTRLNIDYFTGDAATLKFFLISPDGDDADEAADEKGYELDLTNLGQWNRAIIDLTHFADVVDLSQVFQLKVEGTGTVYFDNIFFYGGGSGSGDNYSNTYGGAFGGASVSDNKFNFPSSAEAWAGFAELSPATLSFPNGGKITFKGTTAGTDVDLNFKFERLAYDATGNGAADTEPSFSTANVTVSGTDETTYTVAIPAQDADNTYASHLLYLVTRDAEVTLTDIVITAYSDSGDNYSNTYGGAFGGASVSDNKFNFPSSAEAWAGFAELSPATLSFPNGGKITFKGATAGTDVDLNFKFERLAYDATGNGAADTEPSFSTANVTVSGTDETTYTVAIPAQDADNTYASHLLYLVTRDAEVTLTDIVITAYHSEQ